MPPRILFVLHQFGITGIASHTRDLIRGLQPDYEPRLVFPDDGHLVVADGRLNVVARLPAAKISWPLAEMRSPAFEETFGRIVAEFKPDLVHVQHLLNWPLDFLSRLTDLGLPVVLTLHDYFLISPDYSLQGVDDPDVAFAREYCLARFGQDITAALAERREVLAESLKKTSIVISPSPFLARFHARIYPGPVRVIEHGIEKFTPLPKVAPLPNAAGRRPLRFAYVGGMYEQKGWQPLLAAFAEVRAKHGQAVELHLFGSGYPAEPPPIDGIVVRGRFQARQLPAILAEIDVGVIPSIFAETYSLALSEFWHAGVPVAASDIGALGDRVRDGENGMKFRPGDVNDMGRALNFFVESDAWRRWHLPSPRSLADMAAEYRALYADLLKPRA